MAMRQRACSLSHRDRNVGVVPLRGHHRLDRIGDQIARLERKTHPLVPSRSRRDADRVEAQAHRTAAAAFLHFFGEGKQMMLHGLPSNQRLAMPTCGFDMSSLEAGAVEHGLGRALRFFVV